MCAAEVVLEALSQPDGEAKTANRGKLFKGKLDKGSIAKDKIPEGVGERVEGTPDKVKSLRASLRRPCS